MAKSDLLIAELNTTIEDLKDYNTKLENDLQNDLNRKDSQSPLLKEPYIEDSDEYMDLKLELARAQKEALDKTGSPQRQASLAGAAQQAQKVSVTEIIRLYNDTPSLKEAPGQGELNEGSLQELKQKHFTFIEEMRKRHTYEMKTLKSEYENVLELEVRKKESEMRNTIIEDGELEDLASQVNDLAEAVKKKDRQIQMQEDRIESLRDQTARLKALKSNPTPTPQIFIENPEGLQQCLECVKKSDKIQELSKSFRKAKQEIRSFAPELNRARSEPSQVSHIEVHSDIDRMRCEVDSFASDIRSLLEGYRDIWATEVSNVTTQTVSRVLPPPRKTTLDTETAGSTRNPISSLYNRQQTGEHIRSEKESQYKAEIFDLKVKLKDAEGKFDHLQRKAFEVEQVPRISTDGLSSEQLKELLHEQKEALGHARRLHGQNIATMRKRHDRTVRSQQDKIQQLEVSLQQFVAEYGTVSNSTDNITDMISVSCHQDGFSTCTVITDNLNSR